MQLSTVLSALLLSSMAASAPLAHVHHQHEKRAYATVVVTQMVTVTSGDSATEVAEAPAATSSETTTSAEVAAETKNKVTTTSSAETTSSSVYETTSSSSEEYPRSSEASTSSSSSSASEVYSSTSSSSSSEASSSSDASSGSVESYAEQGKGITYSPYSNDGSCKSSSDITSDIGKLSSYDIIRVYAPDCGCVSTIMSSMGSSQKLFAGVYTYSSIDSDLELLKTQVESSSQGWDGIYAVAIGNEWVQNGEYDASSVASAVSSGKSTLQGYGFTGSVVTVDTIGAYQGNTELCDASDFIAVNAHPFWNGEVSAEDSGSFLQDQISTVKDACGSDKSVLITETGWPTQGNSFGSKGVPSKENQLAAIKSIVDAGLGDQCIMFTTYDDLWKDGGSYGVEQYWGIYTN